MRLLDIYTTKSFWKHMFSFKTFLSAFLTSTGTIWLGLEVINFFNSGLADKIKTSIDIWAFLAVSVLYAIFRSKPNRLYSCRLKGRDTIIEIYIGDYFDDTEGAFIISSNTSFDTSMNDDIISEKSVQGQFTRRYYGTAINHLDSDLSQVLNCINPISINDNKKGKAALYEVGTTASIKVKDRKAYFVALASMNNSGSAYSKKEDVLIAISRLWNYIIEYGGIEPLIIPVVGTGFSRLPDSRDIMVKEIIKSFVAACSTRRFTERLRIVISPNDMKKHDVNISELVEFLCYTCKYTHFDNETTSSIGQGIQ